MSATAPIIVNVLLLAIFLVAFYHAVRFALSGVTWPTRQHDRATEEQEERLLSAEQIDEVIW